MHHIKVESGLIWQRKYVLLNEKSHIVPLMNLPLIYFKQRRKRSQYNYYMDIFYLMFQEVSFKDETPTNSELAYRKQMLDHGNTLYPL